MTNFVSDVFKITLGVMFGVLLANIIEVTFVAYSAKVAMEEFNESRRIKSQLDEKKRLNEIRFKQNVSLERKRYSEGQARIKNERAQKEYAFDQAFYKWYVVPAGCEPSSGELKVGCINHLRSGKKTFRQIYDDFGDVNAGVIRLSD